jgi:hypothetical protein
MTMGMITDGRITLCGSGGSSDCLAVRVLKDGDDAGKIELSSSYDEVLPAAERGRFALEPHEVAQFVQGYLTGALPPDVKAAIDEDMAKHPELPAVPEVVSA